VIESHPWAGALLVSLGAVGGAALRWWLVQHWLSPHWAARHRRHHLPGPPGAPWATMTVNLLASGVLGLLVAWPGDGLVLWLGVGFAGSLSTFSTMAVDVVLLLSTDHRQEALALAGASLVGGYSLLALGLRVAEVWAP